MYFPKSIQSLIKDRPYDLDSIGKSDSQVLCFEDMVLKIQRQDEALTEYRMMQWLSGKLPVPKVLHFTFENGFYYLLMSRVSGEMACSDRLLSHPLELVQLLSSALQLLWQVDIDGCPRNTGLENTLKLAEYRVRNHLCTMEDAEPGTYGENEFRDPQALLEWLKANRPVERLVFSHGDFCLPNLFFKDGQISGFIDLGRSGTADIYQDIALCCRSLQHNLDGAYGGRVYEKLDLSYLFEALKIKPDFDKIRYYILLDELF